MGGTVGIAPHSFFVFQQVGGAIARVALGATAYINRDAAYDCFAVSIWIDPGDDLGDEGEDRISEAYGSSYDRLAALKRKYEPDNLFKGNQNFRPNE